MQSITKYFTKIIQNIKDIYVDPWLNPRVDMTTSTSFNGRVKLFSSNISSTSLNKLKIQKI